jgi:pyruvate dehydrogenase E2 component (dihydrolipoamide acetyltransferase)
MFGVTRFTPLLNPPQAAILSVGALHPGSANLGEAQETILTVGMVCDHRIVYGAHAAAFLQSLRALLEEPIPLMS